MLDLTPPPSPPNDKTTSFFALRRPKPRPPPPPTKIAQGITVRVEHEPEPEPPPGPLLNTITDRFFFSPNFNRPTPPSSLRKFTRDPLDDADTEAAKQTAVSATDDLATPVAQVGYGNNAHYLQSIPAWRAGLAAPGGLTAPNHPPSRGSSIRSFVEIEDNDGDDTDEAELGHGPPRARRDRDPGPSWTSSSYAPSAVSPSPNPPDLPLVSGPSPPLSPIASDDDQLYPDLDSNSEAEGDSEHSHPHSHSHHARNTPPPSPLHPNTLLPHSPSPLLLLRPLGVGSFSSVWLAKDITNPAPAFRPPTKQERLRRFRSRRVKSKAGSLINGQEGYNSGIPSEDDGVEGLRPSKEVRDMVLKAGYDVDHLGFGLLPQLEGGGASLSRAGSLVLRECDGDGGHTNMGPGTISRSSSIGGLSSISELDHTARQVALKLIPISLCVSSSSSNDPKSYTNAQPKKTSLHTSYLRELALLRTLSHPSVVTLLGHFNTPTYHVLVLEYLPGGDLLDILNVDENYLNMTEEFVRRVWSEIVRAVGWLHGVGIVHRDIKLENILLTMNPFVASTPHVPHHQLPLPPLDKPLAKLSDFNLARHIQFLPSPPESSNSSSSSILASTSAPVPDLPKYPPAQLLTTKCGSESYAAPEIILGSAYDGRETDCWAMGVLGYALVCRRLPFAPQYAPSQQYGGEKWGRYRDELEKRERREELMRIARGEWGWPVIEPPSQEEERKGEVVESPTSLLGPHPYHQYQPDQTEYRPTFQSPLFHPPSLRPGGGLAPPTQSQSLSFSTSPSSTSASPQTQSKPFPHSQPPAPKQTHPTIRSDLLTPQFKEMIGTLLIHNPGRRNRMVDMWGMAWMNGEGRVQGPKLSLR